MQILADRLILAEWILREHHIYFINFNIYNIILYLHYIYVNIIFSWWDIAVKVCEMVYLMQTIVI